MLGKRGVNPPLPRNCKRPLLRFEPEQGLGLSEFAQPLELELREGTGQENGASQETGP